MTTSIAPSASVFVLVTTSSIAFSQSQTDSLYISCPQVPSLHCHNNSTTCIEGNASIDARHSHLNLPTNEGGYHCVCQDGYIGHECRMQVDNCNDDDPTTLSCYHGSKCRSTNTGINTNNIDEENGEGGGYYCDCLQLNNISGGPTAMKYAGLMCQHEATSLCAAAVVGSSTTTSVSSPGYYQPSGDQFCTNHGKCVKLVTSYDSHPGCVCMFGWGGDHCEVWHGEGSSPSAATLQNVGESSRNVVAWYILFGLFIVALSAVAMGTVILLIEAIRRQRGSQPNVISAQSPIVTTAPNEEERDAMSQEEEREVYTQSGNDHDDSSNPEIV